MAGGDTRRLKLAATLLMTLPGMPVIYYGTEVGLTQRHDGVTENAEARLPMLWGADQDRDLLAHFQHFGGLRHESAPLRRGARRTLFADAEVLAFERVLDDERVIVALNLSERPQRRHVEGAGTLEVAALGWKIVHGAGADRLRQDDVLGVSPDQRPG
jgi:glycosidase